MSMTMATGHIDDRETYLAQAEYYAARAAGPCTYEQEQRWLKAAADYERMAES